MQELLGTLILLIIVWLIAYGAGFFNGFIF